jgi:hypothetical protein
MCEFFGEGREIGRSQRREKTVDWTLKRRKGVLKSKIGVEK